MGSLQENSTKRPLHTQAKRCDRLVVRNLDFSSRGCLIEIVRRNWRQAYLLEIGLTQIPIDHETLFSINFLSMIIFLGPWTFTFQCEANLDSLCNFLVK